MFRLNAVRPARAILPAVAAAAVLSGGASAQIDSTGSPPATQPEELEYAPALPDFPLWDFRIGADGYTTTAADFDAGGGSLSRTMAGVSAGATITLSPKFQLRIDGRGEYRHYEFSDARDFDPESGDPFDSLYRTYIDGLAMFQATERWQVAAGMRISSRGETDADVNDTLGGRLYAGPIFKVNDDLTLGLGVVVQSRLEDNALVAPAPLIIYRLSDAYSFELNALEGIELRWDPSERFGAALEFDWEYNDYRLDDDSFARDGVFRETMLRVGLSGVWRPTPNLDLTAGIGSFVWQELELLDAGGNELSQDNMLPSGYVSVGMAYRF